MKVSDRAAQAGRIEADIVARQQAAVAVERSVLHRLCRDRRAELLEPRARATLSPGLPPPSQRSN